MHPPTETGVKRTYAEMNVPSEGYTSLGNPLAAMIMDTEMSYTDQYNGVVSHAAPGIPDQDLYPQVLRRPPGFRPF